VEQLHWKEELSWDNSQKFCSASGGYVRPVSSKIFQNYKDPDPKGRERCTGSLATAGEVLPVSCWEVS